MDVSYSTAVYIFVLGVITCVVTAAYIIYQYNKYKHVDPFDGEE